MEYRLTEEAVVAPVTAALSAGLRLIPFETQRDDILVAGPEDLPQSRAASTKPSVLMCSTTLSCATPGCAIHYAVDRRPPFFPPAPVKSSSFSHPISEKYLPG